jgi:DNA-binding MarR family transcriptional regulator
LAFSQVPVDRLHSAQGLAYSRFILDLLRANARLVAGGDALARDFGLSAARWLVMGAIREGERSISDIARDRCLARQSVQEIVNDMRQQKLVTLIQNPGDRRAKLVALTAKGARLFLALTAQWAQRANQLSQAFTKAEIATAADVVRRIRIDLDETG